MTNKWNYQPPTNEEILLRDKLAEELELSPVISLLLVRRGLTSAEAIRKYFVVAGDTHLPADAGTDNLRLGNAAANSGMSPRIPVTAMRHPSA